MATIRDVAGRVERGSGILARRIGHALTPEGRPVLAVARIGAVCLIAPPLYLALEQSPLLVPIALGIWCRRAWLITQPVPPDPEQLRRRLVEAVLMLIGDRPGIHLADLYPQLLANPAAAHLDETRIRAALTDAGITIHRSMRVGDVEGRSGLRRAEVEALLRPPPLLQSPPPLQPMETQVRPHRRAVESGPESGRRPPEPPPLRRG